MYFSNCFLIYFAFKSSFLIAKNVRAILVAVKSSNITNKPLSVRQPSSWICSWAWPCNVLLTDSILCWEDKTSDEYTKAIAVILSLILSITLRPETFSFFVRTPFVGWRLADSRCLFFDIVSPLSLSSLLLSCVSSAYESKGFWEGVWVAEILGCRVSSRVRRRG